MVYRADNVNYHNVTDQRKDKNQYCKYGDSDLNVWRYEIRISTARFRGVVGNVRKHRFCEEKSIIRSHTTWLEVRLAYQPKSVFTKQYLLRV